MKEVRVANINISNNEAFTLIAGLNVLEEQEIINEVAEECQKVTKELEIPFIFKASYDKANRSSYDSFRGPGVDRGLELLKKVKLDYKVPVISDVHSRDEILKVSEVIDAIQIPAFLCRQTDLLVAAASSGKVLNIKKGQFLTPWDVRHVLEKTRKTAAVLLNL